MEFDFQILLQQILNGLVLGSVYALVALGYTMVYGILQLINFAHGDVLMIGAMLAATLAPILLAAGVPGILVLIIVTAVAIPVCILLAVVIERVAYRPLRNAPRLAPLITAIGVSILIQTVAMMIWKPNPRPFPDLLPTDPIMMGEVVLAPKQLLILVVAAAMMIGLTLLVNRTRLGRAMRATAWHSGCRWRLAQDPAVPIGVGEHGVTTPRLFFDLADLESRLLRLRIGIRSLSATHAISDPALPDGLKDPFDRMIVAIAEIESTGFLTTDAKLLDHPLAWRP